MTYKMDQVTSRSVTPLDSSQIVSRVAAALDRSLQGVTQKAHVLSQQFNAAVNISTPVLLQPASAPSHAGRSEVVAILDMRLIRR